MPVVPGVPAWVENIDRSRPKVHLECRITSQGGFRLKANRQARNPFTRWWTGVIADWFLAEVDTPIMHRIILERFLIRAHELEAATVTIVWPDGKETKLR